MTDDPSDFERPLSADERAQLERPLPELLGVEPDYAPEELAPPVDVALLRRFDRRELPAAESQMVAQLIASYRSWHAAWGELLRSYSSPS